MGAQETFFGWMTGGMNERSEAGSPGSRKGTSGHARYYTLKLSAFLGAKGSGISEHWKQSKGGLGEEGTAGLAERHRERPVASPWHGAPGMPHSSILTCAVRRDTVIQGHSG